MRAVRELSSVTLSITASCFKNSRTTVRSQITSTKLTFLLIITRHSLVRGISFTVCFFFVCSLFLSTIFRQPAGLFKPNFACGGTLVPDVSSPLLGVGGPRRAEKGGNEIFVTMGVNGEFLHFGGF